MTDFVLVHGAWHGGWCWYKVKAFLEDRGHRVLAPDLPGHGDDPGGVEDATMDNYVERVVASLDECDEPAVLVGHSMGGGVIAQAGEAAAEKIERLVFVAAFVPRDGESMMDLVEANHANLLRGNLEATEDGSVITVPERLVRPAFYHDCDEEDIELAMSRLRPQNATVFTERFSLTEQNYGAVEKQFVECIEDQVINILLQREMARRADCLVNTLQTGHSPFFSAPAALASHIARIGIQDDTG